MTVEVDKVKFPTTHVLVDNTYDFNCRGTARTQSLTTKNYTPEFPTTGGIAGFNHPKCNGMASTWATCLDDHRGPVPGKLRLGGWLARYISQPNIKLVVDEVIADCTY